MCACVCVWAYVFMNLNTHVGLCQAAEKLYVMGFFYFSYLASPFLFWEASLLSFEDLPLPNFRDRAKGRHVPELDLSDTFPWTLNPG